MYAHIELIHQKLQELETVIVKVVQKVDCEQNTAETNSNILTA